MSAIGAGMSAIGAGMSDAGAGVSAAVTGGLWLDQLPMELLLKIASWLDLRSILRLEKVSPRYRDAGPLLRQQLRVLLLNGYDDGISSFTGLLELRELYVGDLLPPIQVRSLLENLVTASRHWQKLKRLHLLLHYDERYINELLIQLWDLQKPEVAQKDEDKGESSESPQMFSELVEGSGQGPTLRRMVRTETRTQTTFDDAGNPVTRTVTERITTDADGTETRQIVETED